MEFGKFKVSEYAIGVVCFLVLIFMVLYFTVEEQRVRQRTEQLELEKEILILEREMNNERVNGD